ncbi:MAG: hypothetical protein JWM80_3135 [Cyanobacteria bacterium RYN_339]|nr:hypothetical protein [Cyanobacteria bacterium RYN_339]
MGETAHPEGPWYGLLPRDGFIEQLAAGEPGWLVTVDIDHIKRANDTYGLYAGDGVLAAVAGVVRAAAGGPVVAARMSGDEFALWCPGGTEEAAVSLAEGVRKAVHDARVPLDWAQRYTHESLVAELVAYRPSVTVAVAPRLAGDADVLDVWRRADHAMGRAKNGGRDRVVVEHRAGLPGNIDNP